MLEESQEIGGILIHREGQVLVMRQPLSCLLYTLLHFILMAIQHQCYSLHFKDGETGIQRYVKIANF